MKKLITITLAILLTISVCQCTDAKTENGAIWSYPMTNDSIEWEKLESYAERAEINQIPDSIISSVSTGELLRLVEDYPLLYTVHLYDNPRDAYNVLYDTFNGFRELMSREDCLDEIIKEYNQIEIPIQARVNCNNLVSITNYEQDYNAILNNDKLMSEIMKDAKIVFRVSLLEIMMASKYVDSDNNIYSRSTFKSNLRDIVNQKSEEKQVSDLYNGIENNDFYNYINDGLDGDTMIRMSSQEKTMRTPGGNRFTVIKYSELNVKAPTTDDIAAIKEIGGTVVSRASTTFNCNSYAWLSRLYPKEYQYYWLNYSTEFTSDKTYRKESQPSQNGMIACWNRVNHSAIVINRNAGQYKGRIAVSVMAKFGSGPIIQHWNHSYDSDDDWDVSYYTR